MGASGTIKAAHEVLMEMGEKDGIITRNVWKTGKRSFTAP